MKDVNILINNGVDVKKSLELFGDMETYDSTLEVFLSEVGGKLDKLKSYKEISDMANYAILVHSLKSDAKYFGFTNLAEIALNHEMESKKNNMYYISENFDNLYNEAQRIINLVKKYMGFSYDEKLIKEQTKMDKEKTILIVDDSNIIQNYILKIFKDDFNVLVAHDGSEAISLVKSSSNSSIVAMLLDLNMPNVDGFAVLDYFKENDLFKKIPISIITGADDKISIEKAYKYPIADILLKPFNEKDLKKILEKTINYNI